jgi:hypothetical protein
MHRSGVIFRNPVSQITCFTFIALVVHAFVLKFIFPGYYSPLYPHHSDFYISVALAHSPHDFFQYSYLGYSRPLGMFFVKLIGFLGLHGAILFTVINVAINCSLSVLLVQRVLNITLRWPAICLFCLYCYLLFSQSYFYTFYTQDVLSHLSYFILSSGALLFINLHERHKTLAYISLLFFSIVAFLCKETYALSAILFTLVWALYNKKYTGKISIAPLLTITGALVLVVMFNLIIKSVFINLKTSTTDPYYINLRPSSILHEMLLYAKEGLNVLHFAILAISLLFILFFRLPDKRAGYTLLGCILAAVLSILPNALIPNHHNGGYSFNGAYLLYLPVIFIPILWNQKKSFRWLSFLLILSGLLSPLLNKKEYAKQWWVLQQENTERNLLKSLDSLMKLQPSAEPKKILITGLTMPFYPFHHPASLKAYPNAKYGLYDVVVYSAIEKKERDGFVKFIQPADIDIKRTDEIWMFSDNGSLFRKLVMDQSTSAVLEKNNALDMVIYPDSLKNQKLSLLLKDNQNK